MTGDPRGVWKFFGWLLAVFAIGWAGAIATFVVFESDGGRVVGLIATIAAMIGVGWVLEERF